ARGLTVKQRALHWRIKRGPPQEGSLAYQNSPDPQRIMAYLRHHPRKFRLRADEIDSIGRDLRKWHAMVRRREAEMLFSLFQPARFARGLELGAGDGGQSETIARYCDHLVCTELSVDGNAYIGPFRSRGLTNVEYRLCDCSTSARIGQN